MNEQCKNELDDGARWARAASVMSEFNSKQTTVEANEIMARWCRLMLRRALSRLKRVLWLREDGASWVLAGSVSARAGNRNSGAPKATIVETARTARQRRPQPELDDQTVVPKNRREAALEKVDKICTISNPLLAPR